MSRRPPDAGRAAAGAARPRRRFLHAAAAVVAGVVAALVVAEVSMRAFGIAPDRHAPRRFDTWIDGRWQECTPWGLRILRDGGREAIEPPPPSGPRIKRPVPDTPMGEFVPGARFRVVYSSDPRGDFDADRAVVCEVNAQGLRGPGVAETKAPGTVRVLVLGDSFAFGEGVRDEQTFARRVEASLRAAAPAGRSFEVLNAGVPGYNTADEVAALERRWLAFAPDVVLVAFYLNDAYSDGAFANKGEGLGIYLERPDGIARWSRVADWLQHTARAREVRAALDAHYAKSYFTDPSAFLRDPAAAGKAADWTRCEAALRRAAALSAERGFRLALVVFPELHRLDDGYPFDGIHAVVRDACREIGIPALDLLDVYRGRRAEDLWVHPTDHHPNARAHEIAAAAIEAFLRREAPVLR